MEKYSMSIKKVFNDGREVQIFCTADGKAWGIKALTPIPQEDERRVGSPSFNIDAHRKLMIKEEDGNVVSQMGLSEEAIREIVLMYIHLNNEVGELQRGNLQQGIDIQDTPEGTGEGIPTP